MAKSKRIIFVWFSNNNIDNMAFTDWWDFADYIKQKNEAGEDVNIHKWEYV